MSITNDIKNQFPIFQNHPELVYLDNASTTQICNTSLSVIKDFEENYRANVHRGIYDLSIKATDKFETARISVANLINAHHKEIVFTSGATHGLNLLALSLCPRLTHRDNIVLTRMEHHANLIPWQQMSKHYGFEIRFLELTENFEIDLQSLDQIDSNTKIVSFTLVSNVLGTYAPAKQIIGKAKEVRALTIIDGAQAAAHTKIDVKALDCDFLVFSGHKMYGPTGIGVLYGKKELLEEQLEPFFFGGEMVSEVSYKEASWSEAPHKFEAGTPNITGAIGLGAAADFINKIGIDKIISHERELTSYALKLLKNDVNIFGPSGDRAGIISFNIPGIHPHDIAEIANFSSVALRAGYHCAEPLHKMYGQNGSARISFGIYNSPEDIDKFLGVVTKTKNMFAGNITKV